MTSWVIMTALPPTKGHQALIDFASVHNGPVNVLLSTQPHEPFVNERFWALSQHYKNNPLVRVIHFNETIEQNPEADGFWDMWKRILSREGVAPGDSFYASEPYGQQVADLMDGKFVPFDMYREINNIKATEVRKDLIGHWDDVLPEFQRVLQLRITIFGAESTGKTTLARALAERLGGTYVPEYARPYLETVGTDITTASMRAIAEGQEAMQVIAGYAYPKRFIVQDTDLYSTLGYWQFPHWEPVIGKPVPWLEQMISRSKSDLYLMPLSNIPFEVDPLRYGGDHREGSDEYWLEVAKKNNLPLTVLESNDAAFRLDHATMVVNWAWEKHTQALREYDRGGY